MFLLNGKELPVDMAFKVDGIQYPRNWLRLSSTAEKAAIGITEVPDPVLADSRFYWHGDINMPKALEDVVDDETSTVVTGLKTEWISNVNSIAGALLAKTDWMVVRKAERDIPVDPEVAAKRAAVLAEAARLKAAIAACTDLDALRAVVDNQSWE